MSDILFSLSLVLVYVGIMWLYILMIIDAYKYNGVVSLYVGIFLIVVTNAFVFRALGL
jgi:hypothetical protein